MSFVIWVVKELYILPLYWSIFEATKWAKQFTFILLHLYSNILGSFLSFTISLSGLQQFFHNLSFVHKCLMWCDRVSLIRYYFFFIIFNNKNNKKIVRAKAHFWWFYLRSKNEDCKMKKINTSWLEDGENPNINSILEYKTPPRE